jgi:2-amino-4-hydroxy-6-hydroxymethyldihydropteridine diphosphokinase
MSLIIATGSNIGDSVTILKAAQGRLMQEFTLIAASRIYVSAAVEYENQPDFFNQVLEFELPPVSPLEVMKKLLEIEREFKRNRKVPKGPRTLDIDLIFWDNQVIDTPELKTPHPRWPERSFVIRPLMELPFFKKIQGWYTIPETFSVDAFPL